MKPLPEYIKVKDKCCIFYLGTSYEYLIQLVGVMPYIKKSLPGLNFDIFGRDCYCEYIEGILPLSLFKEMKSNYGLAKELTYDLKTHPILKLLEDIPYGPMKTKEAINANKLCVICPEAFLPTKSLTVGQINKIKELAFMRGYKTEVTDNISNAGWVVGAENGPLFLAAYQGLKTSLIPTGLGKELYKNMFPNGEILNF